MISSLQAVFHVLVIACTFAKCRQAAFRFLPQCTIAKGMRVTGIRHSLHPTNVMLMQSPLPLPPPTTCRHQTSAPSAVDALGE